MLRPVVGSCRVLGDSHGDWKARRKQEAVWEKEEIVMLLGIVCEEGDSGNR